MCGLGDFSIALQACDAKIEFMEGWELSEEQPQRRRPWGVRKRRRKRCLAQIMAVMRKQWRGSGVSCACGAHDARVQR